MKQNRYFSLHRFFHLFRNDLLINNKTFVFSLMVGTVLLSMVLFSHLFYPAQTHGFDIEFKAYKITEDLYNTQLAIYLIGSLSWLFFLPLAYFKLKEKEV